MMQELPLSRVTSALKGYTLLTAELNMHKEVRVPFKEGAQLRTTFMGMNTLQNGCRYIDSWVRIHFEMVVDTCIVTVLLSH